MIDFKNALENLRYISKNEGEVGLLDDSTKRYRTVIYRRVDGEIKLWVPLDYHQRELGRLQAEPQPSSVQALMDAIKGLDVSPAVFKVLLIAADHTYGFRAVVQFRDNNQALSEINTSGETPEQALQAALAILRENYGRCGHCGNYMRGQNAT